jgi:GlcNAc-P-P-Und epimerase
MQKVLITGGSGFIGTNLIDSFLKDGYSVLNVDRRQPIKDAHSPYYKEADILDFNRLRDWFFA